MTIFERVLGGTLFYNFWTKVQQYVFSEGRFMQLITLKPIEVYKDTTSMEIDTAHVTLDIRCQVENLMQRRIDRTLNLLTRSLTEDTGSNYNFDIIIKARMNYEEISKFFNFHFGNQSYDIEKNRYRLHIQEFAFSNQGTKAVVDFPFTLDAKWWIFRKTFKGTASLKGSINFHQPRYFIKTRNLQYTLETESTILRWIDRFYHKDLIAFLGEFLQYNFREELFHAKVEAQQQLHTLQNQSSWISGTIHELDLERMTIESDGLHAIFLAEGKLQLSPN